MKALIWLIILLLAAIGVAAIIDYLGYYDVPMFDVVDQAADVVEAVFSK